MNLKTTFIQITGVVAVCLSAGNALAASITPTFDTFSDLAGNPGCTASSCFGGSQIPTDPTAITTIIDGIRTITLGLSATQRFNNPPLTNDGAGTFFAGAGANNGNPGVPGTGATWNFNFYVNVTGGTLADFQFNLLYDLDPGVGTDESAAGNLNLSAFAAPFPLLTMTQNSQNATFAFLCTPAPGFVTPPGSCPFNPNERGEYSFALVASAAGGGAELGRAAINVEVIPEPASLALLGLGLAGLGFVRRRKA